LTFVLLAYLTSKRFAKFYSFLSLSSIPNPKPSLLLL
jgi:hypothetical protein